MESKCENCGRITKDVENPQEQGIFQGKIVIECGICGGIKKVRDE